MDQFRFQAHRAILAEMPTAELKLEAFKEFAFDVAQQSIAGRFNKAAGVDELITASTAYGLEGSDSEAIEKIIGGAFTRAEKHKANGKDRAPAISILSKADFIKGFTPPDYLIERILQRRFIYALTGQTGHAKTAVALLFAQMVANDDDQAYLGRHRVEKGRVIYFVGENPDDVRMRIIGSDSLRHDDPKNDDISFIPGVFDIAKMLSTIEGDLHKRGEAGLIVIDTSAAYFLGNDEISNTQMGAYARMLRSLTQLPGGPCVLVLCHPIKHAQDASQLLPRGGGSYLAEMDGNLTLWKTGDDMVELYYTKMRGPGFQPMSFRLEPILSDCLKDRRGNRISTVQAVLIDQQEEERRLHQKENEEDRVLTAMLKEEDGSIATWAQNLGWLMPNGEPYKVKVYRIVDKLSKISPKLTTKKRDKWALTDAGKETARSAALKFRAQEEAEAGQERLQL